jgi:hypothetical protein
MESLSLISGFTCYNQFIRPDAEGVFHGRPLGALPAKHRFQELQNGHDTDMLQPKAPHQPPSDVGKTPLLARNSDASRDMHTHEQSEVGCIWLLAVCLWASI